MGDIIEEIPETPFPDSVQELTVDLPLPTCPPDECDPVSEFSCTFEKTNERSYVAQDEWMYAAEYTANTIFGTIRGGMVVNALSGKVAPAVEQIVTAVAKTYAIYYAYNGQTPPLPLPENPGTSSPLSRETVTTRDGTARFRGFCAGIRSLDPDLVGTVKLYVGRVFAAPSPPPPPPMS